MHYVATSIPACYNEYEIWHPCSCHTCRTYRSHHYSRSHTGRWQLAGRAAEAQAAIQINRSCKIVDIAAAFRPISTGKYCVRSQ